MRALASMSAIRYPAAPSILLQQVNPEIGIRARSTFDDYQNFDGVNFNNRDLAVEFILHPDGLHCTAPININLTAAQRNAMQAILQEALDEIQKGRMVGWESRQLKSSTFTPWVNIMKATVFHVKPGTLHRNFLLTHFIHGDVILLSEMSLAVNSNQLARTNRIEENVAGAFLLQGLDAAHDEPLERQAAERPSTGAGTMPARSHATNFFTLLHLHKDRGFSPLITIFFASKIVYLDASFQPTNLPVFIGQLIDHYEYYLKQSFGEEHSNLKIFFNSECTVEQAYTAYLEMNPQLRFYLIAFYRRIVAYCREYASQILKSTKYEYWGVPVGLIDADAREIDKIAHYITTGTYSDNVHAHSIDRYSLSQMTHTIDQSAVRIILAHAAIERQNRAAALHGGNATSSPGRRQRVATDSTSNVVSPPLVETKKDATPAKIPVCRHCQGAHRECPWKDYRRGDAQTLNRNGGVIGPKMKKKSEIFPK